VILYWFLIYLFYFAFRTYFRRIYLINLYLLPKDKPVLLASNHPNSFLDGIILAAILRRKVSLLARGDAFRNPIANWTLRSMRLLPIFRSRDVKEGDNQISLNQKTYNECYDLFNKNRIVVIFPESVCVNERRLRPLKKGAAKMAFGAFEKYPNMDIMVVPVGLNYSNPRHFRQDVCINFGHPIPISDYFQLIAEEKQAKAIVDLNERLSRAIEQEMVIIKEPKNDFIGAQYLEMARNEYKPSFFGFFKKTKNRFLAEKRAATDLNNLFEEDLGKFEIFEKKIIDYYEGLNLIKISDKHFSFPFLEKIFYLIFTLLTAIPAFAGLLLNFLPTYAAKKIADSKVKKEEFYDSVIIGLGGLFGIIYSFFLLIACLPFLGRYSLLVVFGIRLLGYLFLFWHEAAINTKNWFILIFSEKGRNIRKGLESQRQFILDYFG